MRSATRLALCAAISILTLGGSVVADEAAMEKYRNYLPEQILALPESVRKSEVPIAYIKPQTALTRS